MKPAKAAEKRRAPTRAEGQCRCGAVQFEIGVPARWAWHDHNANSRRAHAGAYAIYVGCWRSRFRILKGEDDVTRFTEPDSGHVRSFCNQCGTPIAYERAHAPQMINIPRALIRTGAGREPRYHIGIDQLQEWTYQGKALFALKGFPCVVWTRAKRKRA